LGHGQRAWSLSESGATPRFKGLRAVTQCSAYLFAKIEWDFGRLGLFQAKGPGKTIIAVFLCYGLGIIRQA
jgi:hypothetical protein